VMASVTVYTKKGKKSGTVELNPVIFDQQVNVRLLSLVSRLYANNKRTGNAHTKTRAEVRGGGKKPWRQKGTGRARTSSIRNPIWRGGGTIFGPRKRDIYFTVPKAIRKQALISALSKKVKDNTLFVVDDLMLSSPKTKELFQILTHLNINNKNMLWVVHTVDENIQKASRNIKKLSLKRVLDVNAYHVLRKNILLLDAAAVKALEERVLNKTKSGGASARK